jgi:serine/threonine protein kinase
MLIRILYDLSQAQIVHRDIKLDNLFRTSADIWSAELKLGDFGLAKHIPN